MLENIRPLSQIKALITRPKNSGDSLIQKIKALGGEASSLPMLTLEPSLPSQNQIEALTPIQKYQHIIVTSMNAAQFAAQFLRQQFLLVLPKTAWYAIGPSTAQAISKYINTYSRINVYQTKTSHTSESLLALANLKKVSGEHVLLIKGKGGRQLITQVLSQRGAKVTTFAAYQRLPITYEAKKIEHLFKKQRFNVILCHSGETMLNLCHNVSFSLLNKCTIVVPSERVVQIATTKLNTNILNSKGANDRAMLETLIKFQESLKQRIYLTNKSP